MAAHRMVLDYSFLFQKKIKNKENESLCGERGWIWDQNQPKTGRWLVSALRFVFCFYVRICLGSIEISTMSV